MTALHEAFDDIAAEITPVDPPVELAMRRGRRKRHGRRTAVIAGTAGAMALVAGAVAGIPPLAIRPASAPGTSSAVNPAGGAPLARPVLLESPAGNEREYGDASLVNAATLRLFHRLTCNPMPSALISVLNIDDSW